MFWSSGQEAYEILVPQPGIEPASPNWKMKSQSMDYQESPSIFSQ